jgi:hypothetical protein
MEKQYQPAKIAAIDFSFSTESKSNLKFFGENIQKRVGGRSPPTLF